MLTLPEIKSRLEDRNIAAVARSIGMARQQLWLIASGKNQNPTHNTVKKISDYIEGKDDK